MERPPRPARLRVLARDRERRGILREVLRSHDREISVGVAPDDFRGPPVALAEPQLHLVSVPDDVVVGRHMPRVVVDEPGARARPRRTVPLHVDGHH
jgi:hypothetical protein